MLDGAMRRTSTSSGNAFTLVLMRKLACLLVLVCACGEVITDPDPVTVSISPAAPVTTDDLVATVADGAGRTLAYRWSMNAGAPGAMGATLPASMTTKGDTWKVEVLDSSVVVGSAMVMIGDAPATVTPSIVAPTFAGAPLKCDPMATDPDNDPVTAAVAWQKDGAPYTGTTTTTSVTNDTIPKLTTHTGEMYTCIVTAASMMGEATVTVAPRLAYTISESNVTPALQTVDLDTGTLTDIGPLGVAYSFGDLAWDRTAQKLYMVDGRGANALYTVDTTTGAATLVGAHGLADLFSIGFAPSGLYGVTTASGNQLYRFNTSTGAPTLVATITVTGGRMEGLIFDSAHDRMVGETNSGNFFTVDVSSGAVTALGGATSMNDFGLTYDPIVDRYYTMDYSSRLQWFDPTTFAATLVKPSLNPHSSVAIPLPPP